MFCEKDVLKNLAKIHRKTHVPEDSGRCFTVISEKSLKALFYKTPPVAAFAFYSCCDKTLLK